MESCCPPREMEILFNFYTFFIKVKKFNFQKFKIGYLNTHTDVNHNSTI